VSFSATILCVASQRVFIAVVVYFVTDSVQKLAETPSYCSLMCTQFTEMVSAPHFSQLKLCTHFSSLTRVTFLPI
jgi:hypothetical protein